MYPLNVLPGRVTGILARHDRTYRKISCLIWMKTKAIPEIALAFPQARSIYRDDQRRVMRSGNALKQFACQAPVRIEIKLLPQRPFSRCSYVLKRLTGIDAHDGQRASGFRRPDHRSLSFRV